MHYCGITGGVIDDYFRVPNITGLDVDCTRHDFFALCERAPANVVVIPTEPLGIDSPEIKRMLRGDWPRKRNIVVFTGAHSVEEAKQLLEGLRQSIPY